MNARAPMLDPLLRAATRLLPRALAEVGTFIPADSRVGDDFPERRARALRGPYEPADGLLVAVERLGLPARVADFYLRSASYRLLAQPHFPWLSRALLPWFRRAFADPWGQLQFPVQPDAPMTDRFIAAGDERWWVRAGDEGTMYCARFDLIELEGRPRLRVTIPTPPLTLIAVFSPQTTPGGARFAQRAPGDGLHVATPTGPVRRVPLFEEEIELAEAHTGLVVRHRFLLGPVELAALRYLVEPR